MPVFRTPTDSVSPAAEHDNLRRLFVLRNIAIAGQALGLLVATAWLQLPLPLKPMVLLVLALAAFNVMTRMRLTWGGEIKDREFFFQLLVDVLVLTGLLYLTGGATNPFVVLYLLPVTVAVTVLPAAYTWGVASVTALCYSLLLWRYVPLDHPHGAAEGFDLHVLGMWCAFVLSAVLIAYFVLGMRRSLHARDVALGQARESALRNDHLVALGTLAASTAHELGTPLNTMALVSEELEACCGQHESLNVLREQIERCKQALATLSASAGGVRLSGGSAYPVSQFLDEVLKEWRGTRPSVSIRAHWHHDQSAPVIVADNILRKALASMLDNAADASPAQVEWDADWSDNEVVMEIRDRGPGLPRDARSLLGQQPYTSKPDGMGLGLFLAHAIVERLGGTVQLYERDGGGVATRIHLPLVPAPQGASL